MPWVQKAIFNDWPATAVDLPTGEVRKLYESGFAGAKPSPEAWEEFRRIMTFPDGEETAHRFGLADTAQGQLVVPFLHVMEMWPGCWPGKQGQGRGDCVSWAVRNASLTTMTCDIVGAVPDEETGEIEGRPDVPQEGIEDGVLSTESFYWYRGYAGDGWHCPSAAKVATKTSGCIRRMPYPDHNVDLTRYSSQTAGRWGAKAPPESIQQASDEHLIHQATNLTSFESIRDYLFSGYGVYCCGGESFAEERNEDGVAKRTNQGWSHAMSNIGVDDRPVIHQKYGGPLQLILNSWAKWNFGPRRILQSAALVPVGKKALWERLGLVDAQSGDILIPHGSFWARRTDVRNRDYIALSGTKGWPAKPLPPINWSPF